MELRPLYDRLIVERIEEEEQVKGGIVIPDSVKEKPLKGKVIAAGKGKRLEGGKVVPLDVKEGDHVLFGKYSGSEVNIGDKEYLILREDEVLGVLNGGKTSKNKAAA